MQTQAESANFNARMVRKLGLILVGLILFGYLMSVSTHLGLQLRNSPYAPEIAIQVVLIFVLSLSCVASIALVSWIGRRWKPDGTFELRWQAVPKTSAASRRYSLRYLMLVVFWWALALSLTRESLVAAGTHGGTLCYLLSAIAWGGAYGGICLRMRFGLIAGFVVMLALGCYLTSAMWR
jgi:hypothetical protein